MLKVILRLTLSIACVSQVGCILPAWSSSPDVRTSVVYDSEGRPIERNSAPQPRLPDRETPYRTYGGVI